MLAPQWLLAAFPKELEPKVNLVNDLLDLNLSIQGEFECNCGNDHLQIPDRVYGEAIHEDAFSNLDPIEQSVMACLFTRHHDGHVREQFLRKINAYDQQWVISYVIHLCGEYVLEIVNFIYENRQLFDPGQLKTWIDSNPFMFNQIKSRIVSYWDCYYRGNYPSFEKYAGCQLIQYWNDIIKSGRL